MELLRSRKYVEFGIHPHCGMADYLVVESGKATPIARYMDVDGFEEAIEGTIKLAEGGHETMAKLSIVSSALSKIDFGMLRKYVLPVIWSGTYDSLRSLQTNILMIGAMDFMDPYNFDLQRVERCVIHYAVPDGRLIPFCTMNTLHRSAVEGKFKMSYEEYRERQVST